MKKGIAGFALFVIITGFLLGVETAPRISDKEIIERLTRLEEGQKAILREMDKRFEAIDKRFEAIEGRFDSIEGRFDQLINLFIGIVVAFAGIVAVTIGFAIWDRRTALTPVMSKSREIEKREEMIENALRELAKKDPKVEEVLRHVGLL